jgi:hypothetical protein
MDDSHFGYQQKFLKKYWWGACPWCVLGIWVYQVTSLLSRGPTSNKEIAPIKHKCTNKQSIVTQKKKRVSLRKDYDQQALSSWELWKLHEQLL